VTPRLAVVIPCFNDGPLAREAVASVQEDEPVEVVVVDDGSTDPATLATLDALRADGVPVLRQENAGQGVARNRGLAHTTARYVFPLDSDDLLNPGTLGTLADALDALPEDVAVAWGDYTLFGDYDGTYHSPKDWLPWSLTYVDQYPVSSLLRRSALEVVGGWQWRVYEDWDLWLAFVDRDFRGVHVDAEVYRRRMHGATRSLAGARARHRELYRDLIRRHPHAFRRRGELRRLERPAPWRRVVYPVLFGHRAVIPYPVEAFMQRTMMRLGIRLSP
jgi:glycosyltransferase involved in cell wall biosynthesis